MRHDQVFDMRNPRPEQIDKSEVEVVQVEVVISGAELFSKLEPKMIKITTEAVDKALKQVKETLKNYNINVDFKKV